MSYMEQMADNQIEAGLSEKEKLLSELALKDKVIAELKKAVEFYADEANWKVCDQFKPWNNFSVIKDDLDEANANHSTMTIHAGKLARATLLEIEKLIRIDKLANDEEEFNEGMRKRGMDY